jgi:glutathione S-transferase kappa 1
MTPAKKIKITLFFDAISPYTYLCWLSLMRYKKEWNLALDVKPVFLGGIMQTTGNKPPAMLPSRALFMANDLKRSSALYGVNILDSPSNFLTEAAKRVLQVQRMLVGRQIDGASEEELERVITECFHAIHSEPAFRTDTNDLVLNEETIMKILKAAGLSEPVAKHALSRANASDVKQRLVDNTKCAVEEAGAYGSPTMLIHGGSQPFYDGVNPWMVFGSDRFEQIAFVCGLPYRGANPKPISKI